MGWKLVPAPGATSPSDPSLPSTGLRLTAEWKLKDFGSAMQLLQPKVRELQKKYGHDREKLGQETMKLYKEHNANPLASCLPLLLQSPIFIALFRVLDGAARLGPDGLPIARGHWLAVNPCIMYMCVCVGGRGGGFHTDSDL